VLPLSGKKLLNVAIFLLFQLQHYVMAPSGGIETKLNTMHNCKPSSV